MPGRPDDTASVLSFTVPAVEIGVMAVVIPPAAVVPLSTVVAATSVVVLVDGRKEHPFMMLRQRIAFSTNNMNMFWLNHTRSLVKLN